jgi:hypothetical protein
MQMHGFSAMSVANVGDMTLSSEEEQRLSCTVVGQHRIGES